MCVSQRVCEFACVSACVSEHVCVCVCACGALIRSAALQQVLPPLRSWRLCQGHSSTVTGVNLAICIPREQLPDWVTHTSGDPVLGPADPHLLRDLFEMREELSPHRDLDQSADRRGNGKQGVEISGVDTRPGLEAS